VAWNEEDTAELIRRRLELTDEPIHEVYSTSPLLTELFDLPTVEAAAAARTAAAPDPRGEQPDTGTPERRRSRSAGRRRRRRRVAAGERPSAAAG
jgi:hypothetical protein